MSVTVAFVRETAPGERRIALTPETCKKLLANKARVLLEAGAGTPASFPDDTFSGAEFITEYTFNTGVAKHRFCRVCGVKSFYIPRSNPDGVDVNARCLDEGSYDSITVEPFDGSNWEANAASLAHLSST